ncbi:MAG: cytochrome c3 family protein [Pseudomonadota bacterium]
MRKVLVVFGIMVFCTTCLVFGALAEDIPDEITMDSKVYKKHNKSLVTWGHSMHADVAECNDCHHRFEGGENVWEEGDAVQKCEACHSDPKQPRGKGLSKGQKVGSHYWAMHENCRRCHMEQGIDTAVACNHCHPKEKSRWAFTWR